MVYRGTSMYTVRMVNGQTEQTILCCCGICLNTRNILSVAMQSLHPYAMGNLDLLLLWPQSCQLPYFTMGYQ